MMRQWMVTGIVGLVLWAGAAAEAQQLQLPDLSRLSAQASDVVDVSVDQALLGLAAAFMSSDDRDEASIKALMQGLRGIYVKSFTFGKDGAYDPAILASVRTQLSTGQWSRLVTARSAAEGNDVAVYLWRNGDKPGGLAVLSTSPREVTIVNIVGTIDLNQLRALQGQFGVPNLDLDDGDKPSAAPKARPKG